MSDRKRQLKLGISSYTENELVLDVIGNTNLSGLSTIGGVTITSTGIITSSNPGVSTVVYYGDGSNLFGVSAFNVITQEITSSAVYPTFASNTGVSFVGISTNQFVFIPSSGNLGIGTTNPISKLTVQGDVRISGVTTTTSLYVESSINGPAFESYELDDFSYLTDGQENTFIPTFNCDRLSISNPFKLMITVNGIPQSAFINNVDYIYQSNFLGSNNGFTLDTDNNIKFTESIPLGSDIIVRVLPVSDTATKIKYYPFKPTDILLGN